MEQQRATSTQAEGLSAAGQPSSARRDDQVATLARPHMGAVLRLAAALVGPADAEDAAQEALLHGLRAWPGMRDSTALRAWLLRITYNVCTDWLRGRFGTRRAHTQPLTASDVGRLASLDPEPGGSEHAARLDLRQSINHLDPDLRQVIVLRYYVGLDATEIGAALELPPSTVRSHLHRARARLRQDLGLADNPPTDGHQKGSEAI
jgi:RNA polymerase sigma-70 factor (ECF subfamily)